MKEMYGVEIEGDILNHCYKCKTHGDLVNYRKYKWNNNEDNDDEEDNEEYDSQTEGGEDEYEGREDQLEMTDEKNSSDKENEQTAVGHRQTEMTNESGEDDSSDNKSEPDYGGPKCPDCGGSKMWDWSKLKAEGKDEKNEAQVEDNNEE